MSFFKLITIFVSLNFYNNNNNIIPIKRNLKNDIIQMRNDGKSYREI